MKTRGVLKSGLITALFLIILGLAACQKSKVVSDLVKEQTFARQKGDVFFHDYMESREDDWLGWGWSKLRKQGNRLAAYPSSRLRFIKEEKAPLYLFCACRPFLRDGVGAKSIRIEFNNKVLTTVELKNQFNRFLNITIPEEEIKKGNNWIEFFYIAEDEANQTEHIVEDEKRKFSLSVDDLILSTHSNFNFVKKYIRFYRSLSYEMKPRTLIQKVPSVMDFYIDIPPESFFRAQCTYFPSIPGAPSGDKLKLEISNQKPGDQEQILQTIPIGAEKNRIILDFPFTETGVTRLRLKAGDLIDSNTLNGVLIWDTVHVVGQRNREEPSVASNVLSEYRELFTDKNIILIIFDAARADHFSTYGYFRPTTPNTDVFAQNGTVFTNAYSEALSTRCSIGTLFTGFPLTVTSLTEITSILPRKLTTLAQLFKSSGFKTVGYTGIGNIARVFRFHRGFDQYFELNKEEGFYKKSSQYLPYVLPWLEANKDKKFFLYIHFKEPHEAYIPMPPFLGMFSGSFKETVNLTQYQDMGHELTEQQVEYIRACYDETLASADSAFGSILDKLNELGLNDNTIVILTADHGDLLGEHGRQFGHAAYFGEGVMHIPLIIQFPSQDGLKIPTKIDSLVKLSDLFATLADGYQFDIPWELIGGTSLLPVFSGSTEEVNPFIVVERRSRTGFCIRTKSYKLIIWDDAPTEFYNLIKDPQAENNIYHQELVMANYLMTILKKWIAGQELIKMRIFGKFSPKNEIKYDQIDKETIEDLKALGYIK
ncbi:MAG: sulfatase [Candidatus Aminicenantes bacterium]|nr:MAG: sulfatase [Candidatus Aminicenantes bacterium]